jgi:hypothetical protein
MDEPTAIRLLEPHHAPLADRFANGLPRLPPLGNAEDVRASSADRSTFEASR